MCSPFRRCSPKAPTAARKFKEVAEGVHVDYHAMWIAPNDPSRMIVG